MVGYNVPVDGSDSIDDLNIRESTQAAIDQAVGGEVREECVGEPKWKELRGFEWKALKT